MRHIRAEFLPRRQKPLSRRPSERQTAGMEAQHKATIRDAAQRLTVNAFRAHHFAGLRCRVC
ncbi:hypothetical protein SAMN05414137_113186 [Streptacidiphilus jiangxiensis]|uniref:Uncharacterized protein n=1 Tax=Streptacidiphilus jiangxiensis TaxID=235985 RepID=A0A1H7TCE8_STRJI|nr:hypothetical protein SAMN05414137_113186 [Streptacidiphilus jiangxiensis]